MYFAWVMGVARIIVSPVLYTVVAVCSAGAVREKFPRVLEPAAIIAI
jgi:hypothetical protein